MKLALAALLVLAAALAAPAGASAYQFLPGSQGFQASAEGEGGEPEATAGSHPVALTAHFAFPTESGSPFPEADLRDLSLELPPGLLENPTTLPYCDQVQLATPRTSPFETSLSGESCPERSQLGTLTLTSSYGGGQTRTFGLFNLAPPPGAPSEIGANPYGTPLIFVPELRQAPGEYGVTLTTKGVSQLIGVSALTLTIWGAPWSALHNAQRGNCLNEEQPDFGWSKCSLGRPAKTPAPAYLTMPTSCDEALQFKASATSWNQAGIASAIAQGPPLEGCSSLAFEPHPAAQLTDPRTSSPSGYTFDIDVDTAGYSNAKRLASTPVRKAIIELPEGVTINPSVGAGLGVCTEAQYGLESASSPPGQGCPNEAKIGDFTVKSPLIEGGVDGSIYLAAPYQNPSGSLIAVYLVARSSERGILVKLSGELQPDPATGRLTATFDRLPQLPYYQLRIHFREGQRSPLATPASCGAYSTEADLTPWRDPGLIRHASLPLTIAAGIGGGPCPSGPAPFAPQVSGGSLNSQAGAYSPFYLHLTRTDPEQEITSYSATFPPGLLGKLAGIPYCPDAAIAAAATRTGVEERDSPSCPAASRIGHTYSGYGVGTVPTYAPGGLYLAGPYRGSQLSVVAIDSALVGPFDLGTIVIRSAIRVDRTTARASIDAANTDPIPHIVKGIPIHLRDVRVYVDRPGFTVNPTSCERSEIVSALNGSGQLFGEPADDTLATAAAPYQAFNCASLGFEPRISMRLKGGTNRSDRPSLRVEVKPSPGDANISYSQVTLPASIFLDQANIRAICTRPRFAAGDCPPGSRFGKVSAWTPLLDQPMRGGAFLRSSDNALPDVAFALKGSGFEVDLIGRIDSDRGGLRATFSGLPDAPVTRFTLKMAGARRGILQASANLCRGRQSARVRFLAHSNRGWIPSTAIRAACKRKSRHRASK